jgi:hypothetical protein
VYRSKVFAVCGLLSLISGAALARMTPSLDDAAQSGATECARSLIFNFQDGRADRIAPEVPVWQVPNSTAFFFEAGMTIDADGAPNAYNPDNTGLDDLENAGEPGHWQGVVQDENGNPVVQGPDDPFPGYYVSCTALFDRTKGRTDPTRYVDASKIPYVVLPGNVARQTGAHLGDFAMVVNPRNGKSSYAIFGDIGTMGEGSVALARNLGISPDARNGGTRGRIRYLVFPGSGNGQPRALDEITHEAEKQVQQIGAGHLDMCTLN